jgi:hypothetical protein
MGRLAFMLALLGVGPRRHLGIAIRPGAIAGTILLAMM